MTRARIAISGVLAALVLSSCGGDPTRTPRAGGTAAGPGASSSAGTGKGASGLSSPTGTGRGGNVTALPTPTGTPGARGSSGSIPVSVSLARYCVTPGGSMTATAVTIPGADITFAAFYPGEAWRDFDYHYVPPEANVTGTYSWTWLVKPTVPTGTGRVFVVAGKGPRGGEAYALFEIARAC